MKSNLRLGLIGDNIARSKSPALHRAAGKQQAIDVRYDRLIPQDMELTFNEVFDSVQSTGYKGINVTYPYKEIATSKVTIPDPLVKAIGAVNTVVFEAAGPLGYNTDYSGFMKAYRSVVGDKKPGTVCLIGTGGVGKAVAFGLIGLGGSVIRCVDLDGAKAQALADALSLASGDVVIEVFTDPVEAARGADGLINCTPVGMVGYEGTPLPASEMTGASWAFDAVYTPVDTQFLKDADASALTIISGYELFFAQGVDAWKIFSGQDVDEAALRKAIKESDA